MAYNHCNKVTIHSTVLNLKYIQNRTEQNFIIGVICEGESWRQMTVDTNLSLWFVFLLRIMLEMHGILSFLDDAGWEPENKYEFREGPTSTKITPQYVPSFIWALQTCNERHALYK